MDDKLKAEVERVLELDAKRTRGCWRLAKFSKTDVYHPIKNSTIASCFQAASDTLYAEGEPEANAAFIVSAPQMAEIIRQLYDLCQKQEEEIMQLQLDRVNCNIGGINYNGEDRFKGERRVKQEAILNKEVKAAIKEIKRQLEEV